MRCGVGDYTYSLAKALAAEPATQVGVLTSVSGENMGQSDDIALFPIMTSWGVAEALKVAELILHWSPDVVHIQYPTRGYGRGNLPRLLPIIAFLMRAKVVQTWHESFHPRSWLKLLLKSVVPSRLVVVRPNYRDVLPRSLRWALWNKQYAFIRNASALPQVDLDEKEAQGLRRQYLKGQRRLIVFFGFVYRNKGVELLFDIADPTSDHIVIAGEVVEASDYHRKITALASAKPWAGKVTVTGFLPPTDVAALLAVADAVILPYRVGGGEWNTSIHAAVIERSFVITTSLTNHGYDEKRNIFFATVDDTEEMKSALDIHAGRKREYQHDIDRDEWKEMAERHLSLYETLLLKPQ